MFVFSGILPLVRNESGLAAVLGHEIAHNLAHHVAERLSQSVGTNILLYSLICSVALSVLTYREIQRHVSTENGCQDHDLILRESESID